ncbi:proton pump-interactor 1 [Mercurialis annua]|uniref:proton pump-interactor 1 n=1 Tax=Mercurialis annua TaxID=3986 RepID=UPI0021605549|nr:proton pump-interactor 1 [Mercurialis annua]
MQYLDADSDQVLVVSGSKIADICIDDLNQNLTLDDAVDIRHDAKHVHRSDFVKFRPSQDLISKCKIEQTENLIEWINQKRLDIFTKVEEKKLDRYSLTRKLESLTYSYRSEKFETARHKETLEPLQLARDKLSFANTAYRDKLIKSCLLSDEIHLNNLNFQIRHGHKTLAEEKRLLTETKKCRGKEKNRSDSYLTLEELNKSIACKFYWSNRYANDEVQRRKATEDMKKLKCLREKAIANAAVKGSIWNSLGSKDKIPKRIKKRNGKESEELGKKSLTIRAKMKHVQKQLEAIEKDIISLQKQLSEGTQMKIRANKCILTLKGVQKSNQLNNSV